MKHILLSSALAIAAFAPAAFAEERTVEIAVGVDGPEYGQGVYSVTFDDAETSVENIIDAVAANGYPAQALPDTAS